MRYNAAYNAAWYLAHREKRLAWQNAYAAAHREKVRAASAAWATAHPEEARDRQHRRRVLIRGAFVEKVNVGVLVIRDGGSCGICHKRVEPADQSIDHILPVSRGGAHSYANTRLAHLACNVARGNRGVAQLRLTDSAQMFAF